MKITLIQFIDERIRELSAFRLYWNCEAAKTPEDFPSTLPMADWEEQLVNYLNLPPKTDDEL